MPPRMAGTDARPACTAEGYLGYTEALRSGRIRGIGDSDHHLIGAAFTRAAFIPRACPGAHSRETPMYLGTQNDARDDDDYRVMAQLGVRHVCADPPGNPHE